MCVPVEYEVPVEVPVRIPVRVDVPYPVERIVEVPHEIINEREVVVNIPYEVERPYPVEHVVEKLIEKIIEVPGPTKVIEKIIHVEKIVQVPVQYDEWRTIEIRLFLAYHVVSSFPCVDIPWKWDAFFGLPQREEYTNR